MKKAAILILGLLTVFYCSAQQNDWASVEKVFGKKGTVQGDVFKINYPRTDLSVKVNGFTVVPGLALGSWVGLMSMNKDMSADKTMQNNQATMMGDLVLEIGYNLRELWGRRTGRKESREKKFHTCRDEGQVGRVVYLSS